MPGIVGLIHREGVDISITELLRKLLHFPTYFFTEIKVAKGIRLGQVWRHERIRRDGWYFDEASQTGVLMHGWMVSSSPTPHRIIPPEILRSYQKREFSWWQEFEGEFIVVIVDLRQRLISLYNDRLGTLPFYFSQTEDLFCFGPEIKAVITGLKKIPKFSTTGLINFLSAGYCFGETTLFETINFLKPGSRLILNLDTFKLEKSQLWNLKYETKKEFQSRSTAREALYQAIINGHKLVLCDNPQRFDLFLSGGLDSRGILGVLNQLGNLPTRALGWGLRDDLPFSDAKIAHLIADEFKVPFTFRPYTSEEILQNAEKWCFISELANDNLGWYSEGTNVLLDFYDMTTDFTLKGDEIWGWQGWCHTVSEARSLVFPSTLPGALRSILKSSQLEDLEELYDQQVLSLTYGCTFQNLTDFKDYLYFYGRGARFIFSMGYYSELGTEIRRPYLTTGVLEVVRSLPAKFRVYKNLYVDVLNKYFPRTMVLPNKIVNSLPDWAFDVRTCPQLRQYFLELCHPKCVENGVLADLINPHYFLEIRDKFFGEQVSPISRTTSLGERFYRSICPGIAKSRIWSEMKRSGLRKSPKPSPNTFPVLSRVAMIVLLEKQLSKFS